MPSGLKRYHNFGHDHFVTFSCYRRLPYLDNDHTRILFLDTLERCRERHRFYVYGYVLMPEHVHLLLSEPPELKFSGIFRSLKTETSKQLKGDRSRFWQLNYHDFNVFTGKKFREKLRYMHRNPVKRGLVENPEDCPGAATSTGSPANKAASHSNPTGHGTPASTPQSHSSTRRGTNV